MISPETHTLIVPGSEGKIDQKTRLRSEDMSEIMMFWRRKSPVMPGTEGRACQSFNKKGEEEHKLAVSPTHCILSCQ